MTSWRFVSATGMVAPTVSAMWPDVDKTVIYRELLDWGIDARRIRVIPTSIEFDAVAQIGIGQKKKTPDLWIYTPVFDRAYPGGEAKYLVLVHELAHLRQALTGELGLDDRGKWYQRHHEQDAIRWSARQARKMGWSEDRLRRSLEWRHQYEEPEWRKTVAREGVTGHRLHPR